jgi:hypothetical protein
VIQSAMLMMAVSQLLARALEYALIAVSFGKSYAVLAVAAEVGFFFLYKLARGDFYYNVIKLSGITRVIAAFFERFVIKITVDFTGLMVGRNPNELGGL